MVSRLDFSFLINCPYKIFYIDKLRDSIFANDLIDRGPDEQYLSELQNYTEQEIRALMEGNTSAFSIPYQQQTFLVTLFRYHSEYSNNIRNNVPMQIFFYE